MALPAEKKETIFTYADYLTWDEDERIELIDGEAVMMAPPSTSHQIISMEISRHQRRAVPSACQFPGGQKMPCHSRALRRAAV